VAQSINENVTVSEASKGRQRNVEILLDIKDNHVGLIIKARGPSHARENRRVYSIS